MTFLSRLEPVQVLGLLWLIAALALLGVAVCAADFPSQWIPWKR